MTNEQIKEHYRRINIAWCEVIKKCVQAETDDEKEKAGKAIREGIESATTP